MSDHAKANAYLRTRVMTASPEELRLMLLDGAIKFARQAEQGLESKDYERSFEGFGQCRDIILELMNTIRDEPDPALAANVRNIYAFIYSELISASLGKDLGKLRKSIELIEFERETWVMLMEKVAEEKAAGVVPAASTATKSAATPSVAPTPQAGEARKSFSFEA